MQQTRFPYIGINHAFLYMKAFIIRERMCRERERERNHREENTGEWERVKYRGRKTVRDRARTHGDPGRTHADNRDGQPLSYNRVNWRDKNGISSFY